MQVIKSDYWHDRGRAARELDARQRHRTGVAKARSVAALIRMLLADDGPLLVGAWHRDVYDILMRELADFSPIMYTGSETPKQKREAKEAFRRGDTRLMFMSIRSGAGLDGLQEICNRCLIAEMDWSPQVHTQFIGRLRRRGQRHPVEAYFPFVDQGSDPVMMQVNGLKASQSHGILNPFGGTGEVVESVAEGRMKRLARFVLGQVDE